MNTYLSEVVPAFFSDPVSLHQARSVTCLMNVVFSYGTCIARLDGNKLILNADFYSTTTSKLQNALRREARYHEIEVVEVKAEDPALDIELSVQGKIPA